MSSFRLQLPVLLLPFFLAFGSNAFAGECLLKPYTVEYQSKYKFGWFSFDIEAKRHLTQLEDGRWRLAFDAEASMAKLNELSVFNCSNNQIMPSDYLYRAGGLIDEDDRTLVFLPSSKTVKDQEKDKTYQGQWQDGIQDNLTYIQQASIALAQGATEFSFPVFEKKKTKVFRFRVEGEETVKVPAGEFRAIKVRQIRDDKDREIYAWFAKQDGYPLIRLKDKDNGKEKYRIEATRLTF